MNYIRKGDIVFSRDDNDLLSKWIRRRTLSQWSHCGIVVDATDQKMVKVVSARFPHIVEDTLQLDWPETKTILRIRDISSITINRAIYFAYERVGHHYDIWGLFGFLLFRKTGAKSRWFCSELIYEAYRAAGMDFFAGRKEGDFVTPQDLYESPLLDKVD